MGRFVKNVPWNRSRVDNDYGMGSCFNISHTWYWIGLQCDMQHWNEPCCDMLWRFMLGHDTRMDHVWHMIMEWAFLWHITNITKVGHLAECVGIGHVIRDTGMSHIVTNETEMGFFRNKIKRVLLWHMILEWTMMRHIILEWTRFDIWY